MKRTLPILLTIILSAGTIQPALAAGPFSGKANGTDIRIVCDTVAAWQTRQKLPFQSMSWPNGAFYAGVYAWAEATENEGLFQYLRGQGKICKWRLLNRSYHADDICAAQMMIAMSEHDANPSFRQPAMERAFYVASHPSEAPLSKRDPVGKDTRWSWCDALFMAPPVYAALFRLTGEQVYADYLNAEYRACVDSLYDRQAHLFYRDCYRIRRTESNGAKQFWGRGEGWVLAGLALVLQQLPADYPGRSYYEDLFLEMAPAVLACQDPEGHWHASMLNPEAYPLPENSASAFLVYGLAWGLRNGLLPRRPYEKAVKKGWAALVEAVREDGMLGYVQAIGDSPKNATEDSSAPYGAGAFLLAGSEMLKLYGDQK